MDLNNIADKITMSEDISQFKPYSTKKFTTKEEYILGKNKRFYAANPKYLEMLLEIINGEANYVIRDIEWFVTNYAKEHNTVYKIRAEGEVVLFNVYIQYKNQLDAYSKNYFDPFCRKKKIIYSYTYPDNKKKVDFISSIGQLNFFQWAFKYKVIKYLIKHFKEVKKDMARAKLAGPPSSDGRRRRQLSQSSYECGIKKINTPIYLEF